MIDRFDDERWVLTDEGMDVVADMVVELAIGGYSLDTPEQAHDAATFLIGKGFDYGVNGIKILLGIAQADILLRALRKDMEENGKA